MSTATASPSVEAEIQDLVSSFAAAWNRHDAKALAAHFTEDGDLINPTGREANGRQEIEALFADEHSRNFAASRMNQSVKRIRVLSPDIVVATSRCEMGGVRRPGTDELCGMNAIATFVLRNTGGNWKIVSARPMVPVAGPPAQNT